MQQGKLFINSQWVSGSGAKIQSLNPADQSVIYEVASATPDDINNAVTAARAAQTRWADLGTEKRIPYLVDYRERLSDSKLELAQLISMEMGKPIWEALTEIGAMIGKIDHAINAYNQRCATFEMDMQPGKAVLKFNAHGVVAVFGPFNFPGHVPNGHIVPALLAGNTIIYKPSELTPMFAQKMIELWAAAGLPKGVINLVQGSSETGIALTNHPDIDGIFFTGSARVGCAIQKTLADRPGTILALELGGNNPLIVDNVADHDAAAYTTILSAFITSGQRCTCSSRLIVPRSAHNDVFIQRLIDMTKTITVGNPADSPEPFMGPVVSAGSAEKLLAGQQQLIEQGGKPLIKMETPAQGSAYLTPGIIDVSEIANREDEELFGPILQLIRVDHLDEAIREANNTRYGLAAGLLSDDQTSFDTFYNRIKAGVVNWNRQTTGASSRLPFGGVGMSGNHRPSGFFAADYCAWPMSSLITPQLTMPENTLPGITI